MSKLILAALAASTLTAGCAADPTDTAGELRSEREYSTGSNIPKRKSDGPTDGPSVVDRDAIERGGGLPTPIRPGKGT